MPSVGIRRPWLGLLVTALGVWIYLHASTVVHASTMGIDLWWHSIVPIIFSGYMLGRLGTDGLDSAEAAAALMGLATFPAVGGILVLDAYGQGRISSRLAERAWVWANFTNPLLLPLSPSREGVLLLSQALVAVFACFLLPSQERPSTPLTTNRWPHWAADGMNWAALYGVAVVAGSWLHVLMPASDAWLVVIDPVTRLARSQPVTVAAIALNGLIFLGPQLLTARRLGLPAARWLFWRLLAGLLAGFLAWSQLKL